MYQEIYNIYACICMLLSRSLSSVYSRNDKSDVSGNSVVESMVVVAEV